jgi:uncharacterized protein YwbE
MHDFRSRDRAPQLVKCTGGGLRLQKHDNETRRIARGLVAKRIARDNRRPFGCASNHDVGLKIEP